MFVCLCISMYTMYRLWRPEESTGFPRAGVIGSGKPLDMSTGN